MGAKLHCSEYTLRSGSHYSLILPPGIHWRVEKIGEIYSRAMIGNSYIRVIKQELYYDPGNDRGDVLKRVHCRDGNGA